MLNDNGYEYDEVESDFGDIARRWLVVRSEQASKRESATLEKAIAKEEAALTKQCWHLKNQQFACKKDAEMYVETRKKGIKFHRLIPEITATECYAKAGRSRKDSCKEVIGYTIHATTVLDQEKKEKLLCTKGIFILATNQLDKELLPSAMIFHNYKEQQFVERGFGFLKDSIFMADTVFLKKPERIEALMVVMCLCLLVYNFAQHTVRKALVDQQQTLPN